MSRINPRDASVSGSSSSAPVEVARTVPHFYVTPPQRIGSKHLLLAVVLAVGCMGPVLYALRHSRPGVAGGIGFGEAAGGAAGFGGGSAGDQDDDDPSRVDTIYLGGPNEAPVAKRPGGRPSTVHPFVTVRLPRSGSQTGQIPDTAAGRLLYGWMAAFNSKDLAEVAHALPLREGSAAQAAEQAGQLALRRATGGFTLVSAREVVPGVIVFRLHDQTAETREVLGTLQVRPGSNPATISSFNLREVETTSP